MGEAKQLHISQLGKYPGGTGDHAFRIVERDRVQFDNDVLVVAVALDHLHDIGDVQAAIAVI